jgi:hypothetical protein
MVMTLALAFPALAGGQARVVVVQWPNSGTDFASERLQKQVRTELAGVGEVSFVPDWVTFQAGRTAAATRDEVLAALDGLDLAAERDTAAWVALRDELHALAGAFLVEGPEDREPMFRLHVAAGEAAVRAGELTAPWFRDEPAGPRNLHWTFAARFAADDPTLLDGTDGPLAEALAEPPRTGTLSFERSGVTFDAAAFAADNRVLVDGRELVVTGPDGALEVWQGPLSVTIRREDGPALAVHLPWPEAETDLAYFPLEHAALEMKIGLLEDLMSHPNEIVPDIAEARLAHLATYAALYPDEALYVAAPVSHRSTRTRLWHLEDGALRLVGD